MRREMLVPLLLLIAAAMLFLVGGCACGPGAAVSKDTEGVGTVTLYVECDL